MTLSSTDALRLDQLRRAAKTLKKAFDAGDDAARQQMSAHLGRTPQGHSDFLHVIARQNGFLSWPKMKHAADTIGLDRAERQEHLKMALFHGNTSVVEELLSQYPDLPLGNLGLICATYNLPLVQAALEADPGFATEIVGVRRPILHLAFSKYHEMGGDLAQCLEIAQLLVAHGADVNDGFASQPGGREVLSALYGALGHARNLPLAAYLLQQGANPNDGESLYHATELGSEEGLTLLLSHGADPRGTNALLRAMDFDNPRMVALLLEAGADPEESRTEGYNALHHAGVRDVSVAIVRLLINAGASQSKIWAGMTPRASARLLGADAVMAELDAINAPLKAPDALAPLLDLRSGQSKEASHVDPAKIPAELHNLLQDLIHRDGTFDHIKALVAAGFPWDLPGSMRVTPVQTAGWCGLPDLLDYFLRQKPDLSHVSDYGGTLFSGILHGAENAPTRTGQDHLRCLKIVLDHGVALPKQALKTQIRSDLKAFLRVWADRHPGQVVEHGIW